MEEKDLTTSSEHSREITKATYTSYPVTPPPLLCPVCVLLLALGVSVLSACAGQDPTAPSPTAPVVTPAADPVAVPPSVVAPLAIYGPGPCVEADTLPDVVVWTVENIPPGTNITAKGFFFDDTPNCEATEQHGRTQNSHLRVIPTGPSSVRIEFDNNANLCRGRVQVDVGNFFGRILKRSTGKVCTTPDPDPEPEPAPVVSPVVPDPPDPPAPPPPPPLTCDGIGPYHFDFGLLLADGSSPHSESVIGLSIPAATYRLSTRTCDNTHPTHFQPIQTQERITVHLGGTSRTTHDIPDDASCVEDDWLVTTGPITSVVVDHAAYPSQITHSVHSTHVTLTCERRGEQ